MKRSLTENIKRLLMCFSLFIGAYSMTIAQWQVNFPAENAGNIATNSAIVVQAPAAIFPNSVSIAYPEPEANGIIADQPTVMILDDAIAERTPRVNWPEKSIVGEFAFDNPQTLRFTPHRLLPNTRYRVVVSSVLLAGGYVVQPREWTFRTVIPVPEIVNCSIERNLNLRCSDSINLVFSTPVDAPTTQLQSLITLRYMGSDSVIPIMAQYVKNNDNTALTITPFAPWKTGAVVQLTCHWQAITGNELSNRRYSGKVLSASKISIKAISIDSTILPDSVAAETGLLDRPLFRDQNIMLATPEWIGQRWQFIRWECTNMPELANPTESIQEVTLGCAYYGGNIGIRALYKYHDSATIVVQADSHQTISIHNTAGAVVASVSNGTMQFSMKGAGTNYFMSATTTGNYTSTAWNAANTPFNNATTTIVALNAVVQQAVIVNPPNINNPVRIPVIRNNPFNPVIVEEYKLKVSVIDDDHEKIEAGVDYEWLTDTEFVSVTPATRLVKFLAKDNFEIMAVYSESHGTHYYAGDDPKKEYEAELELLKPINHVTILVRRTRAILRSETRVLKTRNGTEFYPGVHPDETVTIAIISKVPRAQKWKTVSKLACNEHGIASYLSTIPMGSEVRYIIETSEVKGSEFIRFGTPSYYVAPTLISSTPQRKEYEVTINENMFSHIFQDCGDGITRESRARLEFFRGFGIDKIGLSVRVKPAGKRETARFELRWYEPDLVQYPDADETEGGHQMEYVPFWGTDVQIRFTSAVNINTVRNGGLNADVYQGILPQDPSSRMLDGFIVSAADGRCFAMDQNGQSKTIKFRIADPSTSPRKQASYNAIIDFGVSENITSLAGAHLISDFYTTLQNVEIPGVVYKLTGIEYEYDYDPDFIWANSGEMYHSVWSGNATKSGPRILESDFRRIPGCDGHATPKPESCMREWDDDDGVQPYDNVVYQEPFFFELNDTPWFRIDSYDEDCKQDDNCLFNALNSVLDQVKTKAKTITVDGSKRDQVRHYTGDLISFGAEIIQSLLPENQQDDNTGEMEFLENHGSVYGMWNSLWPNLRYEHTNNTYSITGVCLVHKSVRY
jgi:hypothetical protein